MNGGIAGPLLDSDPNNFCGTDCLDETLVGGGDQLISHSNITRRQDQIAAGNTTVLLASELTANKGPLFTAALALFGSGTFLDTWPQTFSAINASLSKAGIPLYNETSICLDVPPMHALFLNDDGTPTSESQYGDICIYLDSESELDAQVDIQRWLFNFQLGPGRLANAFTAAAFLANQAWMEANSGVLLGETIFINYDVGADSQIPVISLAGMIVISVLLFLYLVPLLALAVYAAMFPRWTGRLDSFAMMRLGAAFGDKTLPLLVGRKSDQIKVLDDLPGVVRDVAAPDEDVGQFGLGEGVSLRRNRRYRCYASDNESLTWKR
ncbi:hypothetical protein VTN77DRAFT_4744 [Rasamsonia byssochlamydoides]|uniref:uncharacterized protein n=1 Tax=Rasamsonia byssochlamydoides TaxID=89139 RepID=UPI0037446D82